MRSGDLGGREGEWRAKCKVERGARVSVPRLRNPTPLAEPHFAGFWLVFVLGVFFFF